MREGAAAGSAVDQIATAPVLADLLAVSERTVRDLAGRGLVIRTGTGHYAVRASVRAYVTHLRAEAAARGSDALAAERAREARERADGLALRNAAARGELVPVAEVERTWTGILRDVRARMLAVPGRVATQVAGLTAADVAVLELEVREALAEAGGAP
jgi:phage terminase Nu1 subunit (DNA packaging protein)